MYHGGTEGVSRPANTSGAVGPHAMRDQSRQVGAVAAAVHIQPKSSSVGCQWPSASTSTITMLGVSER